MSGEAVDPAPMLTNTCYSFMSDTLAAHVTSVHRYDRSRRRLLPVEGAGGLSAGDACARGGALRRGLGEEHPGRFMLG